MWYAEILAADASYHQQTPLTYGSETKLGLGQIVRIPLRQKLVLGFVTAIVQKPKFNVKLVSEVPQLPPLPAALQSLLAWMKDYYPAPLGQTMQLFLPNDLPRKPLEPSAIPEKITDQELPPLTKDQTAAIRGIAGPGVHLLHGETGTGKTRVYLELSKTILATNRSVVILTPEISLTSQLAKTFRATFGNKVILMHSGLTNAVRRQQWQHLLEQKEPMVVIGARSALFSPLHDVGLIVIDESHEPAYKQDQAPYYHTTTVAAKLAAIHGATLVLGSATPSISDYYIAQAKKRPILPMTQLAASTTVQETSLHVIDLKDRKLFAKSKFLSDELIRAIKTALQKQEQSLLFLNRRGTARVIFCEQCGWQALCPHCDLPLIYHGDQHIVRCHTCVYKSRVPSTCPECKHTNILFKSIGTKAIADEVARLFPEARVMRFDTDNLKSERLEAHYDTVHGGGVDILVGTQTLAKGLDLPKLGLIGVIVADTSLFVPDFSAQERTYQLLHQVLGRIGRGHRKGTAVIQTYSPDSSLIHAVTHKKWNDFYNKELSERSKFLFPPFCYLLKLSCKRATNASAQKTADSLASKIRSYGYNVVIEGPSPSLYGKLDNKFVWQLIVKTKQRGQLTAIIKQLPSGWSYDIDPINLL